jgi:hypothetical protein
MWIVKIALDRPYTFIILALLILLLSPVIILRTPVDIFPSGLSRGKRYRLCSHFTNTPYGGVLSKSPETGFHGW